MNKEKVKLSINDIIHSGVKYLGLDLEVATLIVNSYIDSRVKTYKARVVEPTYLSSSDMSIIRQKYLDQINLKTFNQLDYKRFLDFTNNLMEVGSTKNYINKKSKINNVYFKTVEKSGKIYTNNTLEKTY